jgi:phage protein
MKTNLNNLNNYLFEQLERLYDEDEDFDKEVKRAKSVATIGTAIINNAKLILDAKKYTDEMGYTNSSEVLKLEDKLQSKDDRLSNR